MNSHPIASLADDVVKYGVRILVIMASAAGSVLCVVAIVDVPRLRSHSILNPIRLLLSASQERKLLWTTSS